MPHEDPTPRNLPERTGKHYCITCLAEVSSGEYFRNDCICDACATRENEEPETSEQK